MARVCPYGVPVLMVLLYRTLGTAFNGNIRLPLPSGKWTAMPFIAHGSAVAGAAFAVRAGGGIGGEDGAQADKYAALPRSARCDDIA